MTAQRLSAVSWVTCLLATLASLVLLAMGIGLDTPGDAFVIGVWGGFTLAVASLAFSTVGALVAAKLPENRVGWIFCVTGQTLGIGNLTYQYADQVLYGSAGNLPAGEFAAWLQNLGVPPAFGMLGLALLLFPDGHVPSIRWRPAVVPAIAGAGFAVVGYSLRAGPLDEPFETVVNPFGIPGSYAFLDWTAAAGWLLMGLSFAIAAAAMRTRHRRARGLERQQLKWVALAAAFAGAVIVAVFLSFFADSGFNQLRIAGFGLAFPAVPIAAGVAILRHRLYDIDVVINRTLVYGALTATLACVYLASNLLLQLALDVLTAGSGLAVAASTLATAALVRPARARIQEIVDRRFFRRKYDATRTLEVFGSRLREEIDLKTLQRDLRSVVAETMQPAHLSLWLPAQRHPVTISGRTASKQGTS